MIDLSKVNEIYLYTGTTDFRYGIYGLSRLVLTQFQRDEIKHNLYLFCSKSKKCIKILEFEENGVWMYYKKLDVGKYIYPDTGEMGTKCDIYTRITGYYREISAFNPGKQNEYKDRKSFSI